LQQLVPVNATLVGVKVSEVLRLIGKDGWYLDRQKGSLERMAAATDAVSNALARASHDLERPHR
jgi:predicted RNA binding protein YcfA (HicA-like mRNA interferase family)